jgi:glucosylceramidase
MTFSFKCACACGAATLSLSAADTIAVYLTEQGTENRLTQQESLHFKVLPQPAEKQQCVFVDPSKTFQTLLGIGGAITDAAAETFDRLPEAKRRELVRAYYDPEKGIGYSLIRTNIGGCDFSSASYDYVKSGDVELKTFDISPDLRHRIPLIRAALATARPPVAVYASPWSPPSWMKTNGTVLQGGALKPEYRDAWARHFVKFIQAYEKNGIPIWGLTVQNEPMAVQIWESCIFSAQEERDFVKNHLGPTLAEAGYGDRRIIVWDHNRTMMYHRAQAILSDPTAAKYVWGVGFHWYVNDSFDNVRRTAEAFPSTHLIMTEGCDGPFDTAGLDRWELGEGYGRSMIADFNNGTEGWTDWNILLDETGGPNHKGNFCFAPIHGDTRTGALHYTNAYWYIGHFSKFIRPGAKRIVSSPMLDTLQTTAFKNPDGSLAVIVMNVTAAPQPFLLWVSDRAAETNIPAHSIMTLVIVP